MKKVCSIIFMTLLLLPAIPRALAWETERPSATLSFDKERTGNATTNDEASVSLGVHVTEYYENSGFYRDGCLLRISSMVNT